jgi:hypothetical protein
MAYRNASRVLILDILKIFNSEDNNNFIHFIDDLTKKFNLLEWMNPMSTNKLEEYKSKLLKIKGSHKFRKLKTIRDKFVAHDAKDKGSFAIDVSNVYLYEIVSNIKNVYNDITFGLLNQTHSFDISPKPNELELLYRFRLIQDYLGSAFAKNRNLGELQEIHDIAYGLK